MGDTFWLIGLWMVAKEFLCGCQGLCCCGWLPWFLYMATSVLCGVGSVSIWFIWVWVVARELLFGWCEVVDCYQSFYINMLVGFAWLPECFYLTDKWECGLSISCLCALARFFCVVAIGFWVVAKMFICRCHWALRTCQSVSVWLLGICGWLPGSF